MRDWEPILATAVAAARLGAAELLRYYGHATIQHKGSTQDLVTQADLASEAVIMSTLRKTFPDHHYLTEEGAGTASPDSDRLWVVDPLDGTNNFAHGIPQFCVSIAYAERGVPCVGVVYDPMREELFTACVGKGATCNGQPIRVAERSPLDQCIIATGFYYDRGEMMERTLNAIRDLFRQNIRGIRRFGGAAIDLCWVANGRFDGFFEYQLKPWDYAAATLIIGEAGGKCADRTGAPLRLDSGHVIGASRAIFDSLCHVVHWPDRDR